MHNAKKSRQERLAFLWGKFSWIPPPWLKKIPAAFHFWNTFRKKNPKKFWFLHLALLFWIAVGISGYLWYVSLPKPVRHSFNARELMPTPLEPLEGEEEPLPDTLLLVFDHSVAPLNKVGADVTEEITVSPILEGVWKWEEDNRLLFTPKADWPVGEEYKVSFKPTLFAKGILLDRTSFYFSSPKFSGSIAEYEFYQDPSDPKIKKVVATVIFSHPVDTAQFEKNIRLELKENPLPFTVTYNKFQNKAYIHSEPIQIPPKDTQAILTLKKGARASRGGPPIPRELSAAVAIPGIHNFFKVEEASLNYVRNPKFEPEQVLVLETTDGVKLEEIQKNLDVYLLPKDKPALQGQPEEKDHHWYDVREIGPEILNASQKIPLKIIPTDKEFSRLLSFKLETEQNRQIYIRLNKGIASYGGYILSEVFDKIIAVGALPAEVAIMHPGAILSFSGEKGLTLLSQGVKGLHFEIGRVLPEQINHLVSQTEGRFDSPLFFSYAFKEENITEKSYETLPLAAPDLKTVQYSSFDFSKHLASNNLSSHGLFFLKVRGWDPDKNRFMGGEDGRFLLITDLGILVKDSVDGSHDIFVLSIRDQKPVPGAVVEVIGKNGLPVMIKNTDSQGHALFPSLKDFEREKEPTVYLVRRGNDLSFLPYDKPDRQLNLSRFDVGGVHALDSETEESWEEEESPASDAEVLPTLEAYLFSDRGIYRPGEMFHVGIIIKGTPWEKPIAGIPLEAVVVDPRGLEVQKYKIELSENGFEEIEYTPEENAPTGEYQASLYIVKDKERAGLLGSTTIRVEEFQPDRMRITTRFSSENETGWVSPFDLKGRVNLKNLFGTPAAKRTIYGYMTLLPFPATPSFTPYKDYLFFDPYRAEKSTSERFSDQQTDDNGEAAFDFDLKRFATATYRLIFTAEGFEVEGGRAVTSQNSILVSPLPYLIGYKPDGDLKYISKGMKRSVDLMAIDPSLKQTVVTDLTAEIVELRFVSILTKQPNGTYKYESVRKEIPVDKQPLAIPEKGKAFSLPTQQAGDFALLVRNAQGKELHRIEFSVAGEADLTRSLEKNAELQIRLNKGDFSPGETIEMEIIAPYTGAGLITIERDKIYAYQWFQTKTTSSIQTIRIPEELESNAYVNVSFVRDFTSEEIFMSPLSYGVVPFAISREKRLNPISLKVAEEAKPGENYTIRYKTEKPAKIVVFAVDEGILQVAHYKTPDPLNHFFRKKALEVATRQILDLILPEFKLENSFSSPGGDEEGDLGKNLNPFKRKGLKPVVYWSGILDASPEEGALTYEIPDYFNGTLRVMAVAVSQSEIGVTEEKSLIRGDFIIAPNVPTFVAPGDSFWLSAGVTNNKKGSGEDAKILLTLETSSGLEVVGEKKLEETIPEGKEGAILYQLKAKPELGPATVTFSASEGETKAKYSVELSIRPATPYLTTISGGYLKDQKREIDVSRKMFPQFRELLVSLSASPLGLLPGLQLYLENFPHLCTEQLVSRAVPFLFLKDYPGFEKLSEEAKDVLKQTLQVLTARQNEEGAFGFWAANSHVDDYQTAYAIHFLTEARERGIPVSRNLLNGGIKYLSRIAGGVEEENSSLSQARTRAYAIYLLTRNAVLTTNDLTKLVEDLNQNHKETWKKDLTALYLAATYKLLQKDSEANRLLREVAKGNEITPDYNDYYDSLSHDSQTLYIVAKHFPEQIADFKATKIMEIHEPIANGYFNTISAAYAIMGLVATVEAGEPLSERTFQALEIFPDGKTLPLPLPDAPVATTSFSEEAVKIGLENKNEIPLFYSVSQAGFDKETPKETIQEKLEVSRDYLDEKGDVVQEIPLGSIVQVRLRWRTLGPQDRYANIAIVDLLPGGFEADLESIRSQANSKWAPDYVDIREDRLLIYGDAENKMSEYIYKIRATNAGTYATPPPYAESMYDRKAKARGLAGEFVVNEK